MSVFRTADQEFSVELEHQLAYLLRHREALDEEYAQIGSDYHAREKEWLRKIEFEQSLLDRQREYVGCELGKRVAEERKKVAAKRMNRRVDEESEKLRHVLEKAEREAQLMGMIADNYQKEIARRKASSSMKEETTTIQRAGVQSANMVLFASKKVQQQMVIGGANMDDKMMEKVEFSADDKKTMRKSNDGRKTPKIAS